MGTVVRVHLSYSLWNPRCKGDAAPGAPVWNADAERQALAFHVLGRLLGLAMLMGAEVIW